MLYPAARDVFQNGCAVTQYIIVLLPPFFAVRAEGAPQFLTQFVPLDNIVSLVYNSLGALF